MRKGILFCALLCLFLTLAAGITACAERQTHVHAWSDWEVVAESTCQNTGLKERFCRICDERDEEIIPLSGHSYEETDRTDATCTESGEIRYTCKYCGDERSEPIAAKGHHYEIKSVRPATCTENGETLYSCKDCGDEYSEPIPATHTPDGVWISDVNKHWQTCTSCNKSVMTDYHLYQQNNICSICGYALNSVMSFSLINGDTAYEFTGFTEEIDEDIEIPAQLSGKPVTSLQYGAFLLVRGGKITLPDTITFLSPLHFSGTQIDGIYIGAGVSYIEPDTFARCTNLASIEVSPQNPYFYAENNCLIRKSNKEVVSGCKTSVLPEDVQIIGNLAFCGIPIEHIDIPDSVTTLVSLAFDSCTLESVSFGSCVGPDSFDHEPFFDCPNLCIITVSPQNPYYYAENNCLIRKSDRALVLGGGNSTVPEGVTSIYNGAFSGRKALTSVVLPDSVTVICEFAFAFCDNLASIEFGASLQTIKGSAFEFCGALTEISFPASLRSIEICAFYGCSALKKITLPVGLLSVGESAFSGCSLSSVILPASLTYVHPDAFCYSKAKVIWCESTRSEADWDLSLPEGAVIYWGDEWSYVDGVPTLK